MKTYKIYGTKYPLNATTSVPADAFALKGQICDDPPNRGKVIGFVTMDDGSVIECYKKFNVLIIIIPMLLLFLGIGGFLAWLFLFQEKDVSFMGDLVKQGTDTNVVTYSGFPSVHDNMLEIQFQNGELPAKIIVSGDGIETTVTDIEPNQFVGSIPITVSSTEGLVEAFINIRTASSEQSFPIVVELPQNLNGNDSLEGMEGFWYGEQIFAAPPADSAE